GGKNHLGDGGNLHRWNGQDPEKSSFFSKILLIFYRLAIDLGGLTESKRALSKSGSRSVHDFKPDIRLRAGYGVTSQRQRK
ncbi:MAG: hypothetical protein LBF58_06060, partial [Deltaproteobacteria bacterium]|nr:hypothetical protein [Deltaproteobacteria bacterium]